MFQCSTKGWLQHSRPLYHLAQAGYSPAFLPWKSLVQFATCTQVDMSEYVPPQEEKRLQTQNRNIEYHRTGPDNEILKILGHRLRRWSTVARLSLSIPCVILAITRFNLPAFSSLHARPSEGFYLYNQVIISIVIHCHFMSNIVSHSSASSFESVMVVPRWIPCDATYTFLCLLHCYCFHRECSPLSCTVQQVVGFSSDAHLCWCSPGEARLLQPPVAWFALTQLESGVGSTNVHRPRSDEFITLPASFLCCCGGDEWDWPWFTCWSFFCITLKWNT